MKKPIISITTVPAPLEVLLDLEFQKQSAKLENLHLAAPELLKMLRSLLFVAESVAHMKGLEREILPTTDAIREKIAQFD